MERVFPEDVFHTEKHHLHGCKFLHQIWPNKLLRWPREVNPHRKSVLFSEINMVFHKLRESQVQRFLESSRFKVSQLPSQKIFIILSRKPLTSESILRNSEPTEMESSDLFWSSPESTDSQDTTERSRPSHQPGDMFPRKPILFLHERRNRDL